MSLWAYWISNFIWDTVSYIITAAGAMLVFAIFGVSQFTQGESGGTTFLLLLLFGPAAAAFTYMLSFKFKSHRCGCPCKCCTRARRGCGAPAVLSAT